MTIAYRYKGKGGEYHTGIPAHSLTQEEYDALDKEQRKTVQESPLYEAVQKPAAQSARKDGE